MDEESLSRIYIPHIRGQFEQGQAILFTGAGFSRGARNVTGQPMPSVQDLVREYWQLCYPTDPVEPSTSLQDIFGAAVARQPKIVADRTRQLLTVLESSIEPWYELVLSMPWLRAYTLNIDNLCSAANRRFTLPRSYRAVSGTARSSSRPRPRPQDIELIHLNGTLDDLPQAVTFSVTQYAERLATHDIWYAQVAADLVSRCIVFIGTSLEESPLWQHVAIRATRGSRENREFRHRSYLVTPSLSRARASLLSQYNVVWLPFSAEEFAERVLGHMRSSIQTGLLALGAAQAADASRGPVIVADALSRTDQKTEYLLGQEPAWCDVTSGRVIERAVEGEIWGKIAASRAEPGPKPVIVITGTAGSGKTSTLMRCVAKLSATGARVAWVDHGIDASPRDLVGFLRADPKLAAIAIDNADMYGRDLRAMTDEISRLDHFPLVLLEMRSTRVDRFLRQVVGGPKPYLIAMPLLLDEEIEKLIETLDRENRLGRLKGQSRLEQVRAFGAVAGRELIVAMYEATTGKRFRARMIEEYRELSGAAQLIYGLVSLATAHRFLLSQDEVVIAIGDASNSTLNDLRQLVERGLLVRARDSSLLQSRHRVIANTVFDAMAEAGNLYDSILGILFASATKRYDKSTGSNRAAKVIRFFINHDFLYRVIGLEPTRNLYGRCEDLMRDEFHFWLHRGALEVEFGDLGLAENFLNQALGLAPTDDFVLTEYAYMLFRKALQNPESPEAPAAVGEATRILNGLIADGSRRNSHCFHVLGSQGLSWARRGIDSRVERSNYLRELKETVERGAERFPYAPELRTLSQDLQKELLMLATR